MTSNTYITAAVVVAIVTFGIVGAAAPAVAQSDGKAGDGSTASDTDSQQSGSGTVEITAEAGTVDASGNVTVTFTVTNSGDRATSALVNTSAPSGVTVVGHSEDGGYWRDDAQWLFQTIPAGGSVSPSITYQVADNSSLPLTVTAGATAGDQTIQAQTTINSDSANTMTTEDSGSSASSPGFGVADALVALAAVALLSRRQ